MSDEQTKDIIRRARRPRKVTSVLLLALIAVQGVGLLVAAVQSMGRVPDVEMVAALAIAVWVLVVVSACWFAHSRGFGWGRWALLLSVGVVGVSGIWRTVEDPSFGSVFAIAVPFAIVVLLSLPSIVELQPLVREVLVRDAEERAEERARARAAGPDAHDSSSLDA